MTTRSKTAVAIDYQIESERERSIAIGLEREGKPEEAEVHYGASRYFDDKAGFARLTRDRHSVVMGEATADNVSVIAWRPKNTLRDPDQVALDASAERKQMLLGPTVDVCALGLDTADTIGARDGLEKMLAHQMALAHKLAFDFANRGSEQTDPVAATRYLNISVRLMDNFQRAMLAVHKLRSGNTQTVTVQHVHVHGGQTVVAGTMQAGGRAANMEGIEKK